MRLFAFSLCLLLFPPAANGQQQDASVEIMGRMNRIISSLRVARVEAAKKSSELELVAEQTKQLENLLAEYKAMLKIFDTHINNDDQSAAMSLMATNLPTLENRMHSEILLPHQSGHMEKLVFADLLKQSGGNLLRTISKNYSKEFALSNEQSQSLHKISDKTKEQLAEAERRYKEEIKKIRTNARSEIEKTLSPKQLKMLERYSSTASR